MNSDSTQPANDNKLSNNSIALSITCTLILVSMLLSNSDSASWLLRLTLVVWLVHATLSQICGSIDCKITDSTWFQDTKFNLSLIALELDSPSAKAETKHRINKPTNSLRPGLSAALWDSKAFRYASLRMGRALILAGTLSMKVNRVRDDSLLGDLSPSHFYRECWLEDITLRSKAKDQVSFGFKCLSESCVFIYHDGFVKRVISIIVTAFHQSIWKPLCRAFEPRF